MSELEVRACEAADAGVDVPQSGWGGGGRCQVPFYEDRACLGALRRDDRVAPFYSAGVARVADLHNGLGGVDVGEVAPA